MDASPILAVAWVIMDAAQIEAVSRVAIPFAIGFVLTYTWPRPRP